MNVLDISHYKNVDLLGHSACQNCQNAPVPYHEVVEDYYMWIFLQDSVCAKASVEGRLSNQKLHRQLHAHPLQLSITKCVFNQHEYTGHIP